MADLKAKVMSQTQSLVEELVHSRDHQVSDLKRELKGLKPTNSESEDPCSICHEAIYDDENVARVCKDKHRYHHECLQNWVDSGSVTCPMDRRKLSDDELRDNCLKVPNLAIDTDIEPCDDDCRVVVCTPVQQ